MKVEILKTDKRFDIKKGDVFLAIPYFLDPEKVTLLNDNGVAICNQYLTEVKFL